MESVAMVGLAFGIRHAMDADHVAAVASLAVRDPKSAAGTVRLAACWGLGHGTMLLAIGAVALIAGAQVPERLAPFFDLFVAVTLLALGIGAIRRRAPTAERPTKTGSKAGLLHRRAILVGALHGLAGSAAVVLLSASRAHSPAAGLLHLLLFGAGALVGMTLLSLLLSLPLTYLRGRSAQLALSGGVGVATTCIGIWILFQLATQTPWIFFG